MPRRDALKKVGAATLGALLADPILSLFASRAHAASYDFSLERGEAVFRRYGINPTTVARGATGKNVFAATYSARGWLGKTTVTDSLGKKYFTSFVVKKVPSKMAGVELYQSTLQHSSRVIANSAPVGIILRSFFIKGGSKYIPLVDYSYSWYKKTVRAGYISVFDFQQHIAMMRSTKRRSRTFFCNGGTDCPIIGTNTHSAGELLARMLASSSPSSGFTWLKNGEPCHLVVSVAGRLYSANIFYKDNSLMMAIPGHGAFGMEYKEDGDFTLTMPGESFGLEKSKALKIKMKKK
jgi:hypothetical protein